MVVEPHRIHCPYCGEPTEILVDLSVPSQRYIEDCAICCRPMVLGVTVDEQGDVAVDVRHEDDA